MSRSYIIAPSASRDLQKIADYFLTRNIEAGERLVQEFDRKCRNLVQFPHIGRSYEHLLPHLRGIPLSGYIILYEVTDEMVTILHVVHGQQDLKALLSRPDDES
jgi:toxin ParE1/3/4